MNIHLTHALKPISKNKSRHLDAEVMIGHGLSASNSKWKIMDNLDYKPKTNVYGLTNTASAITNGAGCSDLDVLKQLSFRKSKPKKVKI